MIRLNNNQFTEVLTDQIGRKDGLNIVFKLLLEALKKPERDEFVAENPFNNGNEFRQMNYLGFDEGFIIKIPRDCLGIFKPFLFELINQNEVWLRVVSFELYIKGLTVKDNEEILNKFYWKAYSENFISNIIQNFYKEMEMWRNIKLNKFYSIVYIDSIYLKVRMDTLESEAFYEILGLKEDKIMETLAIHNYSSESPTNCIEIFKSIENRGVQKFNLVVIDEISRIEYSSCYILLYKKKIINYKNLKKNGSFKKQYVKLK